MVKKLFKKPMKVFFINVLEVFVKNVDNNINNLTCSLGSLKVQ